MHSAWQTFREAGWVAWIILMFGLVGFVAAIAAALLAAMRSRASLWAGIAAAVLGALTAGLGGLGVMAGRNTVERAIAGDSVRPLFKERIRREGYREAQSAAKVGLFFAAFPLLAGAIAMLTAPRRREEDGGDMGSAVPLVITGVGVLSAGFAFLEMRAPLPGRDIPADDPVWQLMDHADTAQTSSDEDEIVRACGRLADLLAAKTVPDADARVPDLAAAEARCVEKRTAIGMRTRDAVALRALEGSIFVTRHPELKPPVTAARAAIEAGAESGTAEPAPPAAPRAGVALTPPTVSGRLPPEVIRRIMRRELPRIRRCVDRAPAAKSASGEIKIRFVIGADGNVPTASDAGSTNEARTAVPCVLEVVKALSFPRPEGGIVTVTYPIQITADR
jgi:hypothetical protein